MPSPAAGFAALAMGAPRTLPTGTALYRRSYLGCSGTQNWHRAIAADGGELAWDDPLAGLPRPSDSEDWDAQLGGVSPDGQTLVAWVCERGVCRSMDRSSSEEPVSGLWASVDGGETWERWGDFPRGLRNAWVEVVTEDDVAVFSPAWPPSGDPHRAWWFRSGEEVTPPGGIADPRILAWRAGGGAPEPIWEDGEGTVAISASGDDLPRPPGYSHAIPVPDGSVLWSEVAFRREVWEEVPGGRDFFLHVDDQGAIAGAYSWDGPSSLVLIGHVQGPLFAGFLGSWGCKDQLDTVLVDLGSRSVHAFSPVDGIRGGIVVPVAVRPAPD